MHSFMATPRSETPTLVVWLLRTVLVAVLTLGPIVASACSRLEVPSPTAAPPTAVGTIQTGIPSSPAPPPSPSPAESAAQPSPLPSPLVSRGALADVYPELRSLAAAASAFTIVEESDAAMVGGPWSGWGSTSVRLRYTLTRTQTAFDGSSVGQATLWRPGWTAERRNELRVRVPTDVAERFLRDLANVPVTNGPYWGASGPDVHFHFEITISSNAGPVRMFSDDSTSKDGGVPWGVEYGGRQMVVNAAAPGQAYQLSDAPWQAYQLIRPYLDDLSKMTRNDLHEMIRAPGPSPSPVP